MMIIRDEGRCAALCAALSVVVVPMKGCEQDLPTPVVADPPAPGDEPAQDPPAPGDEPAQDPPVTVDPCAPPSAIEGVADCLAYGRCAGAPVDALSLACAFSMTDTTVSCECRSGEHAVRCEQTESGVVCTLQ